MKRHDFPPDSLEARALYRVRRKMGFYIHATVFAMVHLGFLVTYVLGSRPKPLFIWGWAIGLLIHGAITFVRLQGEGLRERLLRQEIERLRRERDQREKDAEKP